MNKAVGIILGLLGVVIVITSFTTFVTTDSMKNLLLGLGVGLIANAITFFILESQKKNLQDISNNKQSELLSVSKELESLKSSYRQQNGIIVHEQFSSIDINSIIKNTKKELKMFVVSGRHILSPQTLTLILNKIKDAKDESNIQVLALDAIGEDSYVQARNKMMDLAGKFNNYNHDLQKAREYARQITENDPEHKKFDIRFYTKLPTTFFIITDTKLLITYLLSKPVSDCPVFELEISSHPQIYKLFKGHFDFYWNSSRFYVTVIGFEKSTNKFMMVHNKKRNGWEWPTGYIEPAETPINSAKREFIEETGFDIGNLIEVEQTPFGIYYLGIVGHKLHDISTREVSEISFFNSLPEREKLSFKDDDALFEELLQEALKLKEKFHTS